MLNGERDEVGIAAPPSVVPGFQHTIATRAVGFAYALDNRAVQADDVVHRNIIAIGTRLKIRGDLLRRLKSCGFMQNQPAPGCAPAAWKYIGVWDKHRKSW